MNDNPFASITGEAELPAPSELIQEYIHLRDGKKAAEDAIKTWLNNNFNHRMDRIETELMAFLNDAKSDSVKSEHGTAFKRTETSVTVANSSEFSRFVISEELWELIDFRANKTAVKEYLEKTEALPPGVNLSAVTVLSVRKPS